MIFHSPVRNCLARVLSKILTDLIAFPTLMASDPILFWPLDICKRLSDQFDQLFLA